MGDWPLSSSTQYATVGVSSSTSTGTVVTASSTVNTKGAWSQLTESTPMTCSAILISARFDSLAQYLLDIGVGPLNSEQVLIPDLHHSAVGTVGMVAAFPVGIPSGSRVAARSACSTASTFGRVSITLIQGGFNQMNPYSVVAAYGADSSDSGGTSIDPGGTVNTKGAWSQLTASTERRHTGLAMALGNQANPGAGAHTFLFDIGIGSSGSETVIVPDLAVFTSALETVDPPITPVLPVDIPAGSRLVVRSQCNTTDAVDRLLDAVLYGVS